MSVSQGSSTECCGCFSYCSCHTSSICLGVGVSSTAAAADSLAACCVSQLTEYDLCISRRRLAGSYGSFCHKNSQRHNSHCSHSGSSARCCFTASVLMPSTDAAIIALFVRTEPHSHCGLQLRLEMSKAVSSSVSKDKRGMHQLVYLNRVLWFPHCVALSCRLLLASRPCLLLHAASYLCSALQSLFAGVLLVFCCQAAVTATAGILPAQANGTYCLRRLHVLRHHHLCKALCTPCLCTWFSSCAILLCITRYCAIYI